ncbi:MAG: NCS2 family permease [Planctomycetota bacterium]
MIALDAWFDLRRRGTTVRREVGAGLTTFLTLSYALFVQPAVLAGAGMDPGGVLFATCVASAVACLAMAVLANSPIALAPAMGHNFFFAFTICGTLGFTWQQGLAANALAGGVLLLLAGTPVRTAILHAIPAPVQRGLAAGIGLLIALLGLQWGNLVVDHPVTLVALGDLRDPVARLSLLGLVVTAVLLARRVRAAVLLGMLATAAVGAFGSGVLGAARPLVEGHGVIGAPPAPSTALQLDFAGLFAAPLDAVVLVVVTLLLLDLFDTTGTLLGVAERAGLLQDGRLPRAGRALSADAIGTVVGASLGTSTVTSYVESAAGVAAGGRTGLTAAVVGVCLLLSLFFTPLVETIGAGVIVAESPVEVRRYPVIAPTLVLVGALMMGALRGVAWDEPSAAIPAFLTVLIIPLTFSITDGIAWGMIAASVLALATGRRAPRLVHGLAAVLLARYVWLM